MSLTKRNVTKAMVAANRANAQKSAGPISARGKDRVRRNALKHWGRAEVLRDYMPALGEDPAEFERVRAGLYGSLDPGDDFEALLVDDLAEIHWHLRRLIRAEAANQAKHRRERMARREELDAAEEAGKLHDLARYLVGKLGFAGLHDSPGKFERVIEFLRYVAASLEAYGFQDLKAEECLHCVYGGLNAGLQGTTLISNYHSWRQEEESWDDATKQQHREEYLTLLNQQIAWFEERAARHSQARAELKAPNADCGLVDGTPDNAVAHQERLERSFERKWKLLMAYRATRAVTSAGEDDQIGAETLEPAAEEKSPADGHDSASVSASETLESAAEPSGSECPESDSNERAEPGA